MTNRQSRRLERLKREVLKPHALKFDLDPELDYARPGNSPPERAFHLLSCGFDLLIEIADSGFPSLDKGVRRRGAKWIRQAFIWRGANAARLLAHAVPTLLAAMGGRISDDDEDAAEAVVDPEYYLLLKRAVHDFYPKEMPDSYTAEFEVMEKRKPREEVVSGEQPANQYSLALLRGEDPQVDSELVEMQRRYARDYFIHGASHTATRMALLPRDGQLLSDNMIDFLDPNEPRLSEYRARALAAWVGGSRPYREYALIEFQGAPDTAAR